MSDDRSREPLEIIITHHPRRSARPLYSAIAFWGSVAGRRCDGDTEIEAIDSALQALSAVSGTHSLDRQQAQIRRQTIK